MQATILFTMYLVLCHIEILAFELGNTVSQQLVPIFQLLSSSLPEPLVEK